MCRYCPELRKIAASTTGGIQDGGVIEETLQPGRERMMFLGLPFPSAGPG